MRPVHLLAALSSALLAAACTPMQWVREDATPAQLDADAAYCQQEAWREARFRSWAFGPPVPLVLSDPAGRPFLRHPGLFYDPFHDAFMEEVRLAQFCMRAKGYRLEAVEKAPKG